jgi:hypothetical protein
MSVRTAAQNITDPQTGMLAFLSARGGTTLDPGFRIPNAHEISGAFEHQFRADASVRIGYVRKLTRDNWGVINTSREGRFTVPFTTPPVDLINYSPDNPSGQVVGRERFALVTIPASLANVVSNLVANVPDGAWTYDTLTVAGQARVASQFFVQGGLDYSWHNEQRGGSLKIATGVTPTSLDATTSPLDSDPIGSGYFQNVRPDVPNRQRSTTWQAHLLGRYDVGRLAVGVAANLRIQSGWPYARIVQAMLPGLDTQAFFYDNIDRHRSDTVPVLDLYRWVPDILICTFARRCC